MAVFESGLPRIFATLLLKFLDRNLLIGLGDNRVSAEHGGRLPASDRHDDRLGHASTAQSTRSASPKIVDDLADVTKATAATLTLCCDDGLPAVAADHLSQSGTDRQILPRFAEIAHRLVAFAGEQEIIRAFAGDGLLYQFADGSGHDRLTGLAILALRGFEANARRDQIALADAQPEQFRLAPAVGVSQLQEEAQPEFTGFRGEPCVVGIFDETGSCVVFLEVREERQPQQPALAVADAEGRFQARQFTVHGRIGRAFADSVNPPKCRSASGVPFVFPVLFSQTSAICQPLQHP